MLGHARGTVTSRYGTSSTTFAWPLPIAWPGAIAHALAGGGPQGREDERSRTAAA